MESILPKNEEHWLELRKPNINSTESPALFNCSPYLTKFELWHTKKKNLPSNFEANERTEWGLFLQDGIAAKFAKDNNWKIARNLHYIQIPKFRLGSSFDCTIQILIPRDDDKNHFDIENGLGEVKNVDGLAFKQGWIVEDDYIEAPAHIEIQAQHQMLVSGLKFNYILALIGGNRGIALRREPNEKIFNAIIKESELFWKSIEENNPPQPSEVDSDFICSLYNNATGETMDARGNQTISALASYYKSCQKEESDAEKRKKAAKAKLLPLIGTASKVLVDGGYSISAGMIDETEVEAYTRKKYRRFSVNGKGEE